MSRYTESAEKLDACMSELKNVHPSWHIAIVGSLGGPRAAVVLRDEPTVAIAVVPFLDGAEDVALGLLIEQVALFDYPGRSE